MQRGLTRGLHCWCPELGKFREREMRQALEVAEARSTIVEERWLLLRQDHWGVPDADSYTLSV